jgi:hypothetical protein
LTPKSLRTASRAVHPSPDPRPARLDALDPSLPPLLVHGLQAHDVENLSPALLERLYRVALGAR